MFFLMLGLRSFVVRCITYGNYVSFFFVIVTYFLFRHNYIIYLFDVVMIFHDVRSRYYFGIFELGMEITLQLRFVFVRHCNVFLLRHNYVFVCSMKLRFLITLEFRYVRITYGNFVCL